MKLNYLLHDLNHIFTLFIVFPAIICAGIYLTLRLRFVQIAWLNKSYSFLVKKNDTTQGSISRFGAISAVLAGNLGTGNISGMAVAIATGGPGALVWMWIMAFLGAGIQYTSCILSMMFRHKTKDGEYVGGPMYYLRDGLGSKKCAILFALFTLFGSITVGNFAQTNSVILPLEKIGFDSFYCSLVIATLVGFVILGGIKRIANFASYIVPVMALVYLTTCVIILILHSERILGAFGLMFHEAFNYPSFFGGVMGASILKAITTGFERGLFATDAGTGLVPILQSSARSQNPVIDGITTLLTPITVMSVCTITGLVLIVTGAWQTPDLQSTNMVIHAFTSGLGTNAIGYYIVILSLMLFAYTTILAWAYCGEKAIEFLAGSGKKLWYRLGFIVLIPVGSMMQVGTIWVLADLAITFMVIINLVGVIRLSHFAIDATFQFARASNDSMQVSDVR